MILGADTGNDSVSSETGSRGVSYVRFCDDLQPDTRELTIITRTIILAGLEIIPGCLIIEILRMNISPLLAHREI
jgi:hypothetical protein